ncbi:MAG: ROK family transcriptional regulator [Propionibacteriaceae bacterium]|jgi:glucokinase|nr:ROK family transcriptional regulator [Propionibacteriaceae bacterium]
MVHDIRELNRSAVLAGLLRHRPVSRRDIAHHTGISAATVTRVVEGLAAEGIVREGADLPAAKRGRRAVLLDVVADRAHVVGVDLGATNTRIIVADLTGRPLVAAQTPTAQEANPDHLADWLAAEIRARAGSLWDSASLVCLGVPGAVRYLDQVISNAPNLPQVEDPTFAASLRARLDRRLQLDNDANYALLGELHFGAASSARRAAMLTIGTGLGAGLAIDRQVLRGEHGLVGEFGQLPVGPLGARLEHMVTGPGILRHAAEAGLTLTSPAELFLADVDFPLANLRAQFDQAMLIVLAAVMVSCEPQCVVLGGGVGSNLTPAIHRYRESIESTLRKAPEILPAALGDYSGAAGAVVAGLKTAYGDLGVREDDLTDLPAVGELTAATIAAAKPAPVAEVEDRARRGRLGTGGPGGQRGAVGAV